MKKEKKTKKAKGNRAELLDDVDLENVGTIESTIEIESLTLRGKKWKAHLKVGTLLPRSYRQYNVKLELDEKPYTDRIEDIEKTLKNTLFEKEKTTVRKTYQQINSIRKELEEMRKVCVTIEFWAVVDEIKYRDGDTLVSCRIPDDVIEPINLQKYRMEAYKIALKPVYE